MDDSRSPETTVTTDDNGRAFFGSLPWGRYRLSTDPPASSPQTVAINSRITESVTLTVPRADAAVSSTGQNENTQQGSSEGGSSGVLIQSDDSERGWMTYLLITLFLLLLGATAFLVLQVLNGTSFKSRRGSSGGDSSPPRSRSDLPRVNGYTTERQVGEGGMSKVYRGLDAQNRPVALKVMRETMQDEDLVQKFIQEGKALERINQTHPDAPVVQLYSYGHVNGSRQPYLALEYLDGTSLEHVIRNEESLSTGHVLSIVRQIGVALSAAHANGVYHRDVKPENVIIVGRGSILRIKLIDFGVARHEYQQLHTMHGRMLGTPPYMCPEQANGQFVGATSDIYSLGIVFYALLAGSPPFVHDNAFRVLQMHQQESIPPLPDSVPENVAELVYWMLSKAPDDRPDSMWKVVGHIDTLIRESFQYS
jgi:serine/threonine protein kinase